MLRRVRHNHFPSPGTLEPISTFFNKYLTVRRCVSRLPVVVLLPLGAMQASPKSELVYVILYIFLHLKPWTYSWGCAIGLSRWPHSTISILHRVHLHLYRIPIPNLHPPIGNMGRR